MISCQLSAATVRKNIEEHISKDFAIIHHGKKYLVHSTLAGMKSMRIRILVKEDPLANSITLNIPEGPTEKIVNYLNNKKVEFDDGSVVFAAQAAVELGIDKLLSENKKQLMIQLNEDIALELLEKGFRNGVKITVFADFLASRFEQVADKVAELPVEIIDCVMRSPYYNASAAFTKVFVLKRANIRKNPNHCLAKHIPLSILENIPGFDMTQKRYTISRMAPVRSPE